jgi:TonB family protein
VIPAVVGPVAAPQGPGEVVGTVTDQTGRSVPGVTVTLVERPSGVVAETSIANARGEYQMTGVKPGIYDLQARLPGFRTFSTALSLSAGSTMTMPVTMNLGSLSETVTVTRPDQPVAAAADPASESQLLDEIARGTGDIRPSLDSLAYFYYRQERFAESAAAVDRILALMDQQAVATTIPAPTPGTVAVGGSIREPRKIRDVKPVYPAVAGGAGGIVILEARIAADGSVRDARVLRGAPVLAPSALGAVRQWRFTPTLLNGVPVDVTMTVTMNFAGQ